jgi:uncharacterized repeat protein (TIGR03803 family)
MKKAIRTAVYACGMSICAFQGAIAGPAIQEALSNVTTASMQELARNNNTDASAPPTITESVLYSFGSNANDGSFPRAGLIQSWDGNFYGTTTAGGTIGSGTVFKVTPAGVETVLHSFLGGGSDGAGPQAALIQSWDGDFYGTTVDGGLFDNGAVFKITATGEETVLHSFGPYNGPDGIAPYDALVEDHEGNFYGTTEVEGEYSGGTLFKITSSGVFTVLHSFGAQQGAEGWGPAATLLLASDGDFYGTTTYGGSNNTGTVFKITRSGIFTLLYSFGATGSEDGVEPWSAMIEGCDGDLFGTTLYGGASGYGTVFKITRSGVETVLHSFGSAANDGQGPQAPLIWGYDGKIYGVTSGGGAYGNGAIVQITTAGVETVLYSFAYGVDGSTDGYGPFGLIEGRDGNFYGTTFGGGLYGTGTVFKVTNVCSNHEDGCGQQTSRQSASCCR